VHNAASGRAGPPALTGTLVAVEDNPEIYENMAKALAILTA
jgi:hypothetical protein